MINNQYGQMTFATIIIKIYNRIKLIIKKKWIKKIVSAFMLSLFTSLTSEILEESNIKKRLILKTCLSFLRVF